MLNKIFAALAALSVIGAANAQSLTIGDPAPAFPIDGMIKGENINGLQKGNVYVVEFWATWCGPCINAMPHLSEVAEQFKGKATIVSVNTWDYGSKDDKESRDAHVKRVTEWVTKNDKNMRYNIAFDTADDTISTTWMRAAGRNGIPCAFIVNGEGRIAWIGHPMAKMEDVLAKVCDGTWDVDAFKKEFQEAAAKEAAANAARVAAQKAVTDSAKANDMAGFEKACEKIGLLQGIQMATNANPEFAMTALEKHAGKIKGVEAYMYCNLASVIAGRTKEQATKDRAVKLSAECNKMVTEKMAALGAIYHANTLFAAGKKDDAITWAQNAKSLVSKYEPADAREGITKYIDGRLAAFNK